MEKISEDKLSSDIGSQLSQLLKSKKEAKPKEIEPTSKKEDTPKTSSVDFNSLKSSKKEEIPKVKPEAVEEVAKEQQIEKKRESSDLVKEKLEEDIDKPKESNFNEIDNEYEDFISEETLKKIEKEEKEESVDESRKVSEDIEEMESIEQPIEKEKRKLFSKEANLDWILRVVFLLMILTIASIVYFNSTIIERVDNLKFEVIANSNRIIQEIPTIPKNIPNQNVKESQKSIRVDTSNFDKGVREIQSDISTLKNSITKISNSISNLKLELNQKNSQTELIAKESKETQQIELPKEELKIDTSGLSREILNLAKELKNIQKSLNLALKKIDRVDSNINRSRNRVVKEIESKESKYIIIREESRKEKIERAIKEGYTPIIAD